MTPLSQSGSESQDLLTTAPSDLELVKQRKWFYEFELPDGTSTETDIPPDVATIHTSRRRALRKIISDKVTNAGELTAIDLASHEGYFSFDLASQFQSVLGLEIREDSLSAARLMKSALGIDNVDFQQADLQNMAFDPAHQCDFVLLYGLLYHLEDPIRVLRLASQMTRRHILIETQVTPFDISGKIEDGHYLWQRDMQGMFAICADYAERREGGSTEIALVPSPKALAFLLEAFGFKHIQFLEFASDDYEQFKRGSRVIIYAEK